MASDDSSTASETLAERLSALKDIVPPGARRNAAAAASATQEWVSWGAKRAGQAAWIVTTSVLLVGVPGALAFAEEQQMEMYDRELRAQESAGQMLTGQAGGPQEVRPSL